MSSRCPDARPAFALALAALLAGCGRAHAQAPPAARALRVCADPNNLPFSNARGEGFENRLADLLARELHATVRYTWWAQHRGFLRNTLRAGLCDVVMGVPEGLGPVLTTAPYYRSTYVFVSRRDRALGLRSLDDPRLRTLRVGAQLVGDDGANTPPVHALGARGITDNVVGFSALGDYARDPPGGAILDAVADGTVDVALVWGPLAGYYVARRGAPLALAPVSPASDGPLPFTFAIAVGVRRGDEALRAELDRALARRRREVAALLAQYGV
ncbi:MAG: putative periplasmic binding protein involved in methanol oxidation, partial [Myxococcaceae bacterium]|nr:putative periplasmic binding protein involved in methanol oxidation [Myxococcaceae bacterium]